MGFTIANSTAKVNFFGKYTDYDGIRVNFTPVKTIKPVSA